MDIRRLPARPQRLCLVLLCVVLILVERVRCDRRPEATDGEVPAPQHTAAAGDEDGDVGQGPKREEEAANAVGTARKVYINGWEIDTRYLPDVGAHAQAAAPFLWAKRAPPTEEEAASCAVAALVQVEPPLSSRKVREITEYLGVPLGSYHARNAYLLTASLETVRRARTAPHVVWVRTTQLPSR